jgi:flavorubredoxin
MNQYIRPVQITPEAHVIESFWKAPGAPVGVHINTMVLASREPVVFDTGVAADLDGWLAAVSSVVDPADVRWIVLSHDDQDHVGNLAAAVARFPNATVVASWWMAERLTGSVALDPRRQRWLVSGDTLDIGDRTLAFQRPPIYDSPTTRTVLDTRTGLLWGGDLGGAPTPEPATFADEVATEQLEASFLAAHGWLSPWASSVQNIRYQREVTLLADAGITTWANTHGPVYTGAHVERAIDLLRRVPTSEPVAQPGQAALDEIVASMLVAA